MSTKNNSASDFGEAYARALALLRDCATPDGFVASASDRDNYRRVWGRDGTIISLVALNRGHKFKDAENKSDNKTVRTE
jgi:hypothetical protein